MAKKEKSPLTEHWFVCIVIPLLSIAVTIFVVFLAGWLEKPKIFWPNPLLDQAELHLIEGNYPEAIRDFGEATPIEPDNPRIWLGTYAAQELSGHHEEAVQTLREGTKQVKKGATGGKEIRAALEVAETSPEEGLEIVAESYKSFGFKSLAYKFLQLCVREFDGAKRFVRALEDLAEELNLNIQEITTTTTQVPDDAVYFNGHAYKVYDLGMTWHDAKRKCEELGGHLATITSQAEQNFIEGLITNHERNIYWLGGTDETQSGQWEWVTGEPFEYTNWDIWQPDNDNFHGNQDEHFLNIYRFPNPYVDGSFAGGWNDLQDNAYTYEDEMNYFSLDTIGFICEWSTN
ncbi:MAG: hypothetical protein FWF60_03020 [Oscillospiraceae bacterium]|nr:hypothetical protein [Oscillospiraceae bacterium]